MFAADKHLYFFINTILKWRITPSFSEKRHEIDIIS